MTKTELVSYVAKEAKVAKKAVDAVLKSLVGAVRKTLKKGGEIRINSLGTFKRGLPRPGASQWHICNHLCASRIFQA
ncbi:MAG TPA: HU family DNA-binding protein [Desulfomonilaceae bacterium]|nr:HU family DNA-binding protein [Desulfomonilaceae bacterium]